MDTRDKRISIAQAINIAVELAIARNGAKVDVEDVATLAPIVYRRLFKEVANSLAKVSIEAPETHTLTPVADAVEARNKFIEKVPKEKRDDVIKELTQSLTKL